MTLYACSRCKSHDVMLTKYGTYLNCHNCGHITFIQKVWPDNVIMMKVNDV